VEETTTRVVITLRASVELKVRLDTHAAGLGLSAVLTLLDAALRGTEKEIR
jgi:hypothetical protein